MTALDDLTRSKLTQPAERRVDLVTRVAQAVADGATTREQISVAMDATDKHLDNCVTRAVAMGCIVREGPRGNSTYRCTAAGYARIGRTAPADAPKGDAPPVKHATLSAMRDDAAFRANVSAALDKPARKRAKQAAPARPAKKAPAKRAPKAKPQPRAARKPRQASTAVTVHRPADRRITEAQRVLVDYLHTKRADDSVLDYLMTEAGLAADSDRVQP